VRVTVIAAGFDAGAPTPVRRIETRRPQPEAAVPPQAPSAPSAAPRPRPLQTPPPAPRRTVVFEDDLDVPDFLK
jgi:cell division protein FtsZ